MMNKQQIKNMRQSLADYPSYSRKEMSEEGEPFLSNCNFLETNCGCKIVGNGTSQHPLSIEFCPTHKTVNKFGKFINKLFHER